MRYRIIEEENDIGDKRYCIEEKTGVITWEVPEEEKHYRTQRVAMYDEDRPYSVCLTFFSRKYYSTEEECEKRAIAIEKIREEERKRRDLSRAKKRWKAKIIKIKDQE